MASTSGRVPPPDATSLAPKSYLFSVRVSERARAAHAGEGHGDAVFVADLDDFVIANRAAGLNDEARANGEKGVKKGVSQRILTAGLSTPQSVVSFSYFRDVFSTRNPCRQNALFCALYAATAGGSLKPIFKEEVD